MTNKEYMENLARLKEIEATVKNPESSLDTIDALLDETKTLVTACYAYTRTLKTKVESLSELDPDTI